MSVQERLAAAKVELQQLISDGSKQVELGVVVLENVIA